MNYREFGTTGLKFSEICYGTWRFASADGTPDERSNAGERALRTALDNGINVIHSSHEYGTRWLTGSVLKDHPKRHDIHHVIKVNEPDFEQPEFDRKKFRTQIEDALRDLHTERIAVVQHLQRGSIPKSIAYSSEGDPVRLAEFPASAEVFTEEVEKLKEQDKVASVASFPYTVGYARKAVESGVYDGLVAYFNLLETEWVDLFDSMRKKGMGFIGIRPLLAGLLTDKRVDRSRLAGDDRLAGSEWNEKYEQLSRLRTELNLNPDSWTRYAIRFSLSHRLIASTAVSINSPAQLEDALEAADGNYPSEDDLARIHAINTQVWKEQS